MNPALKSDLSTYFDEFGEEATFQHGADAAKPVMVIFDDEGEIVGQYGVETTAPRVYVIDDETGTVDHDDSLTIRGIKYAVTSPIKPDGAGVSLLTLRRA